MSQKKVFFSFFLNSRVWIFALFAVAANAFTFYFLSCEKTIYYWDYVTYWQKFIEIGETLKSYPLYPIAKLLYSVRASDYNDFPAWFLLPFYYLAGPGRLSYLCSIVNVFAIPACISFAWLSLRRQPGFANISITEILIVNTVFFLNPFIWDPLLSGFLDIGGLLLANVVLGLLWRSPLSQPKNIKSLSILALTLTLMIVFRRWYAFWVEGFFILTGLVALAHLIHPREGQSRWIYLRNWFYLAALTGLIFSLITWPLPLKIIKTDYADIYSSMRYSENLGEFLSEFVFHFGYIQIGAALAGFGFAVAEKGALQKRAFFVMAQGCIVFLLFTRVQDFGRQHYYLLMQPLLYFQICLGVSLRRFLYKALLLLMALVSFGAVFLPICARLGDRLVPLTPAYRHYPEVRHDMKEIGRLISVIQVRGLKDTDRVYVLSSSEHFNSDTLKWAERSMPINNPIGAAVLRTHSVDKTDEFPESLFTADYVVVGDPIQYHRREEDQRVVGIPAESFLNHRGISVHYTELPETFTLDENIRLRLFKRNETIPESEISQMRAELRRYYPDWSEEPPPPKSSRRLWLENKLGFTRFQHY